MAAPDKPLRAALLEEGTHPLERRAARIGHCRGIRRWKELGRIAKRRIVLFDESRERIDPGRDINDRCFCMRGRDNSRKSIRKRKIDLAVFGAAVERGVLVEAQHLDRPLHWLARAPKRQSAFRWSNGNDSPIDPRREWPVHRKLGLARGLAFRER